MGQTNEALLFFMTGFMARSKDYQQLLAPLAASGIEVRNPHLRLGLRSYLAPRTTISEHARSAAHLVEQGLAEGRKVWHAGHSRGGQVAWLAAQTTQPH